jgi:hypothetical protein
MMAEVIAHIVQTGTIVVREQEGVGHRVDGILEEVLVKTHGSAMVTGEDVGAYHHVEGFRPRTMAVHQLAVALRGVLKGKGHPGVILTVLPSPPAVTVLPQLRLCKSG